MAKSQKLYFPENMTGISGSCNAVPSKRSRIQNLRQKKDQKTRLSGIPIPGIVSSLSPNVAVRKDVGFRHNVNPEILLLSRVDENV